jgi:hypothetical protein
MCVWVSSLNLNVSDFESETECVSLVWIWIWIWMFYKYWISSTAAKQMHATKHHKQRRATYALEIERRKAKDAKKHEWRLTVSAMDDSSKAPFGSSGTGRSLPGTVPTLYNFVKKPIGQEWFPGNRTRPKAGWNHPRFCLVARNRLVNIHLER